MLTSPVAKIVADLFYILDTNVRNDLFHNRVADERDYVSRMVTHFNHPFGIFNKAAYNGIYFQSQWFAKVNNSENEKKFGCDSMIIFKVNNQIKVGLFEAKWARLIKDPKYQWDYPQKSTKKSHFTNQIERQSKWITDAVIWEMFFYEKPVGNFTSPFDKNGSTCIRHKTAKDFIKANPSLQILWNNDDLIKLINQEQTSKFDGTNETNLKSIIYDILTCEYGNVINVDPTDNSFTLTSTDNQKVTCPILDFTDNRITNQAVEGFMSEYGLSFFQQVNIITDAEQIFMKRHGL